MRHASEPTTSHSKPAVPDFNSTPFLTLRVTSRIPDPYPNPTLTLPLRFSELTAAISGGLGSAAEKQQVAMHICVHTCICYEFHALATPAQPLTLSLTLTVASLAPTLEPRTPTPDPRP